MRQENAHQTSVSRLRFALVVEAVIDHAPTSGMDTDLIRLLDVDDLPLAFSFGRAGDACPDAIEDVVRKKGEYVIEGPSLEELTGYGPLASGACSGRTISTSIARGSSAGPILTTKGFSCRGLLTWAKLNLRAGEIGESYPHLIIGRAVECRILSIWHAAGHSRSVFVGA